MSNVHVLQTIWPNRWADAPWITVTFVNNEATEHDDLAAHLPQCGDAVLQEPSPSSTCVVLSWYWWCIIYILSKKSMDEYRLITRFLL